MNLSRTFVWRKLRERKILYTHRRVAGICESLIAEYREHTVHFDLVSKAHFNTDRIIWQYWAQGYDNVPPVVRRCLDSVEKYAAGYTVVRLTDENLSEYLDIPEFIQQRRATYSLIHFSDLLRLMLLKVYGGVWMDATLLMTAPIPHDWTKLEFLVFRRDPYEPDYKYWRNTYAYFFGWSKGFRVNMLNSFIVARTGCKAVSELCDLMMLWWRDHDNVPDYFFFQILFDVYGCPEHVPLISDTLPHYLQQSISDPKFSLSRREDIVKRFPIHKLTYK